MLKDILKGILKKAIKPSGKVGNRLKLIGSALVGGVVVKETASEFNPEGIVLIIEAATVFIGALMTFAGVFMTKEK